MNTNDIAGVLDRAADLVEPEGAWIQKVSARDRQGNRVPSTSAHAVRFCALGAIAHSSQTEHDSLLAGDALREAIREPGVTRWNDAPERKQSEVVNALRAAASSLR